MKPKPLGCKFGIGMYKDIDNLNMKHSLILHKIPDCPTTRISRIMWISWGHFLPSRRLKDLWSI